MAEAPAKAGAFMASEDITAYFLAAEDLSAL